MTIGEESASSRGIEVSEQFDLEDLKGHDALDRRRRNRQQEKQRIETRRCAIAHSLPCEKPPMRLLSGK